MKTELKYGMEEREICNRNSCKGIIATHPVENCSCHICPPCGECTSPRNFCPECGWEEKDDVINDYVVNINDIDNILLAEVLNYIKDQSKQFRQCAGHHAEHNRGAEAVAIRAAEILERIETDIRSANNSATNIYKMFTPRPLDPTKIDYRNYSHTHFSMIKEGVYPEGTTMEEVRKVVEGTFGGRFEYFGNGKFKYIAYTD